MHGRLLFLGTLLTLLAQRYSPAEAQSALLIHPTMHAWRIWTNGLDPGYPEWFQSSFDDSAWPTGYGLFGNDNNYPYPFQTVTPPPVVANRFFARTHFVWNSSNGGITLIGTNFIDDGAVVYLNGVEIYRFNMPAGPTTFETMAPLAVAEPSAIRFAIALDSLTNGNTNPLLTGDNVIAVETASNSPFSSDTVWGMSLYAGHVEQCFPPMIQPSAINATACRSVTFAAPDTNCPVPRAVQWYRDVGTGEEAMPGQTGPTLTIASVALSDAGSYFVRVTDSAGTLDSQRSLLRVSQDNDGPHIWSAITYPGSDLIIVTFDEPVTDAAYDPLTWSIHANPPEVIPPVVLSATADPVDGSKLWLRLGSPIPAGARYSYTTTQPIADACAGAETPAGQTGFVLEGAHLLHWADGRNWRYNQSGADQGTAWRAIDFDDSAWEVGPQGFGRETSMFPDAPVSLRTPLTVGPDQVTYYFRTRFRASILHSNMRFYAVVDDGAVIYVNGIEIGRINIGAGVVPSYNLFVDAIVEGQGYLPADGISIPRSVLVNGDNVLAIEVHQASATSADVLLLAKIISDGSDPIDPPSIAVQPAGLVVTEGRSFSLSVLASPASVEYQWTKDGVDIAGATGASYAASAGLNAGGTYRVRISNAAGAVTSAPATVIVRERILGYGATWKYQVDNQDLSLASTPWFSPAFDDATWPSGLGPIGFESTAATLARIPPLATVMQPGQEPRVTTYFRTSVTVPAIAPTESLYLTHIIDDGAAFYFNGQLAFTYNLPGGTPIRSDALAPRSTPGDGDAREITGAIVLPPGTHTMAVEVHQNAPTSADFVFGAEISRGPALPTLQIARESASTVRLMWTPAPGVRLFSSPTADGPYSPVTIAIPGQFIASDGPGLTARYFRLGH